MALNTERLGEALVIHVAQERIDAVGAVRFREGMRSLVNGSPPRVIVDLSQVKFLDSSGLGAVVAVMKMLEPGQRLELAGLSPAVEKVFRLTRMDTVFTIHADVAMGLGHAG